MRNRARAGDLQVFVNEGFDLVIVGGGLQALLLALTVRDRAPGARVAIVERDARLGGNHTWCFHDTDVTPEMAARIAPLVVARWQGHDVAFPRYQRTLAGGYAALASDGVDAAIRATGATVITGAGAEAIAPGEVRLSDNRTLRGAWVIDARGPGRLQAGGGLGYQKFVGLELALAAPHGLMRPVLMDACVPQQDGYRFLYVLPLAADRLLVEDTYFSDRADLDVEAIAGECRAYADAHGWRGELVRREHGVLPLPWSASIAPVQPGLIVAGYAGGWLHPVTGYSLPAAARLAEAIAGGLVAGDVEAAVTAAARAQADQLAFTSRMTRMMFRWFRPAERRGALEHFYRLPEDVIARFYAMTLTRRDRARIFFRRPPRGLSWRALVTGAHAGELA